MSIIRADLHGAISIVNAIAAGKGATLGIDLKTQATLQAQDGKGLEIKTNIQNVSSRLVTKVIEKMVPKKILEKTKLEVSINTEIPTGYGLKSSSAISSAVAMVCAKKFQPNWKENQILEAGIRASLETKVSITGAFDDVCGCYFGGFNVTDNLKRKVFKRENAPSNFQVLVFIPRSRKRGKIKELSKIKPIFERAWMLAKNSEYWNSMILNGLASSSILGSDPKIINNLIENGAIGASISGNGPSIAAVVKNQNVSKVKQAFSNLEGRIIISKINNQRAKVYEM